MSQRTTEPVLRQRTVYLNSQGDQIPPRTFKDIAPLLLVLAVVALALIVAVAIKGLPH